MKKLKVEMFFDHTCPYCYNGYNILKGLMPDYPNIEIDWKPVEAHPKVEEPEHLPYADLAVQGQLFIKKNKGDERAYFESVYHAYFEEKQAPDDIAVLVKCAGNSGINIVEFEQVLRSCKYEKELQDANDYAYETQKVWAVPAFVYNADDGNAAIRLDAIAGIGVTKEQLKMFLDEVSNR